MTLATFCRRDAVGLVAMLVIASSVFYSGLVKHIGARDIDARYFYVAAQCWASGESPYDATRFRARFSAALGSAPEGLFAAYLPTLMPVILPMAPLGWRAAAGLFAALNFSAAMFLLWASHRLLRELLEAPLRPVHWLWLTLGTTVGGVSSTISTGQTSLIVAAACATALLGCRWQNRWMVIAGTVIASAKPSLSAPLLLFIFLFEPSQRRSILVAGGIIAAFIAYAAVLDGNLIANYLGGIRFYDSLADNSARSQIGLGSLWAITSLSSRVGQALGVALLAISLTMAGILYRQKGPGRRANALALALALVFFTTGIVHTIHGYDVCIYAMGISLCSMLPRRLQLVCLAPAVILWRPNFLNAAIPSLTTQDISNVGWLILLTGCIYGGWRMLSLRSMTPA